MLGITKIFTLNKDYENPTKNQNCSNFEVDKWILSQFVVDKLVPIIGFNPFPLDELLLITTVTSYFKPTHIFEWGTHWGKSARIFYEISKSFSLNIEINSTDLPETVDHIEHPHNKRGKFVKGKSNVSLHLGDGLATSIKLAKKIDKSSLLLFFLDGDHEYKSVKRELFKIAQEFPRSIILVHDTFFQNKKSGYNIGPYKAIQLLLKKKPKKYTVISTEAGLPGMTVLIPNNQIKSK